MFLWLMRHHTFWSQGPYHCVMCWTAFDCRFMIQKLFALVSGRCGPDSADSPMNQEVLLGGHLYLMVLKEKIEGYLRSIRYELERQARLSPDKFTGTNGQSTSGVPTTHCRLCNIIICSIMYLPPLWVCHRRRPPPLLGVSPA